MIPVIFRCKIIAKIVQCPNCSRAAAIKGVWWDSGDFAAEVKVGEGYKKGRSSANDRLTALGGRLTWNMDRWHHQASLLVMLFCVTTNVFRLSSGLLHFDNRMTS